MEITSPIPSQLRIRGHLCLISHRGQQRTCFRCGEPGHQKPDCPLNRQDAPPRTDNPPPGADEEQQFDQQETEDNPFDQHEDNPVEQHVDGNVQGSNNDQVNVSGVEIDPAIRDSTQHPAVSNRVEISESNSNQAFDNSASNPTESTGNAAGLAIQDHQEPADTTPESGEQVAANAAGLPMEEEQAPANEQVAANAAGLEPANTTFESGSEQVPANAAGQSNQVAAIAVIDSSARQTELGEGPSNDQVSSDGEAIVNSGASVEPSNESQVVNRPSESKTKDSDQVAPDKEFTTPQLPVRRSRRRTASARSDNSDSETGTTAIKLGRTNSSSSLTEQRRKLAPTMSYAAAVRKITRPSPVPSGRFRYRSNRSHSVDSNESSNDENYERLITDSGNLVSNRIEDSSSMGRLPNPGNPEMSCDFS